VGRDERTKGKTKNPSALRGGEGKTNRKINEPERKMLYPVKNTKPEARVEGAERGQLGQNGGRNGMKKRITLYTEKWGAERPREKKKKLGRQLPGETAGPMEGSTFEKKMDF